MHDGGDVAADADVREAVAARVVADLFEGFGAGYGLEHGGAFLCVVGVALRYRVARRMVESMRCLRRYWMLSLLRRYP